MQQPCPALAFLVQLLCQRRSRCCWLLAWAQTLGVHGGNSLSNAGGPLFTRAYTLQMLTRKCTLTAPSTWHTGKTPKSACPCSLQGSANCQPYTLNSVLTVAHGADGLCTTSKRCLPHSLQYSGAVSNKSTSVCLNLCRVAAAARCWRRCGALREVPRSWRGRQ